MCIAPKIRESVKGLTCLRVRVGATDLEVFPTAAVPHVPSVPGFGHKDFCCGVHSAKVRAGDIREASRGAHRLVAIRQAVEVTV